MTTQSSLDLGDSAARPSGPVTCLGITFSNDAARREHFRALLAEKLKDPEFRKIEGFPIGTDEAILELSDAPYYTACPNPWLADFVREWETAKPAKPEGWHYQREPFAADVSEGKNDPIYNAHSYHTKVPHKAIMRYILHYTSPGDTVFDGFCGTGMTGVAAQMCGDRKTVESLGYKVEADGTILQKEPDDSGKEVWVPFSKLGARHAILNDLSPAATFIAYNYNTPVDVAAFEKEAKRILTEVEAECGWMYQTRHTNGQMGTINYTVWSDVFACGECGGELIFWDVAVDKIAGEVRDTFSCPHCGVEQTKRKMDRAWVTRYDKALRETIKQAKQVPVLINYSAAGKRYDKAPDAEDLALIQKADNENILYWFPICPFPDGDKTNEPKNIGISHAHQMHTARNLHSLSMFKDRINKVKFDISQLGLWFTSSQVWGTKQNRLLASNYFQKRGGVIGQTLQGTYYVSSLSIETNIIERFRLRISSVPFTAAGRSGIVQAGSATSLSGLPNDSLDYIFIDPPFGSNLMYSELNFLWESWLDVRTDNTPEAIENRTQNKTAVDYRELMRRAFGRIYDALKPGRWMTIEFSNTSAIIWNTIQTSISESGFVVANVSALEKTHNGFNAVNNPTSVKQDLVISAYKPNGGFEERFLLESHTEEGVWDFVRTHLKYLPVAKLKNGQVEFVVERDPRIIFDRMVSWYVQHSVPVPVSSQEFQAGLIQRFTDRDGMVFLPEQVTEYDRKRAQSSQAPQSEMFISDERSAIDWLTDFLRKKPTTYQEIHPEFLRQLGAGWKKHEAKPELMALLEANFLRYDPTDRDGHEVPPQIHSYLSSNWAEYRNLEKTDPRLKDKAEHRWYVPDPNKAKDLEKVREKALLKEFETYREFAGRKLKTFRLEVVRAGFKSAYTAKDYATILAIANKLPEDALQEDEKLLMWYDQALTRSEAEG